MSSPTGETKKEATAGAGGGGAGASAATDRDVVTLTSDPLDVAACIAAVAGPGAGATSTFIGTTRDTFDGREVVRLEYEAYAGMAVKELRRIIGSCRERHDVLAVAIAHRLGVVDVLEASVVIAVSSVHRASGLDAVRYLIDTLKECVPIWKKEVYGGSSEPGATWKANKEARGVAVEAVEAAAAGAATAAATADAKAGTGGEPTA